MKIFIIWTLIGGSLIYQSILAQTPKANKITSFIPSGYSVLDSRTGDLNKDNYPDAILILKAKEEETNEDLARPLLLLEGTASGNYKLLARNDSVVLCKGCGGIFGDPYDGITIKNGYFSVEHYGGSSWRWTRIITFKYDLKSQSFKLHRDAGVSYHNIAPKIKMETVVHNKEDFGKVRFEEFNNEKIFEEKQ